MVEVDYCPVHKSLFDSDNRIECHSRGWWVTSDYRINSKIMATPCEWWTGQLSDLKKVYP